MNDPKRKPFDPSRVKGGNTSSKFVNDQLSEKVIGAAIEVHRHLGPGFNESVYQQALRIELTERKIPFAFEKKLPIEFKGHRVGEGRVDFLVNDELIIETKAIDGLASIHTAQVIAYLRASKLKRALLVNFNVELLKNGIKRISL